MRSLFAEWRFVGLLMGVLAVSTPGLAHEGHDHGAPPTQASSTIAPRADASSPDFEIVAIARGAALTLYLDTFRENQPVDGAEIEIDAAGGVLKPTARGAGVYAINAPFLAKPGSYDLAITVSANGIVDILTTTLVIPSVKRGQSLGIALGIESAIAQDGSHRSGATGASVLVMLTIAFFAGGLVATLVWRRRGTATAIFVLGLVAGVLPTTASAVETALAVAARDVAQRSPDGALFVPKPTQRILGLRTIFTKSEAHRRAIELPGRIIPDPNASGLVQASVGGRLSPPEGGFKALGTRVKAGDVLAYVRPPLPLADATAQQQQSRELDQQISIVARRLERYKTLALTAAVAKSQLEEAELELKGLQTRRDNLERVHREPEALVSPVDGVIASANAVAGQMAESNSIIFRIVDPTRLWVEALSFEPQATSRDAQGVLAGGRIVELDYVGTGLADRNQSVPVHFSIRSDATALRAGQFLTVLATTTDERTGIAVPRAAVLRGSNGQSIVFEHSNPESFVPREVRIEQLDAERVLVVAGIEPGKRIVTQGAELLNQIR